MKKFALLLSLFAFFVTIACDEEQPSIKYYDEDTEAELLAKLNSYRTTNGLSELVVDQVAQREAREYSRYVSEKIYSTTDLDGFDNTQKLLNKVYSDAEIEGVFMHGINDADFVMNAWKQKESDNEKIKGDFNYIGVGVVADNLDVYYFTVIFMKR